MKWTSQELDKLKEIFQKAHTFEQANKEAAKILNRSVNSLEKVIRRHFDQTRMEFFEEQQGGKPEVQVPEAFEQTFEEKSQILRLEQKVKSLQSDLKQAELEALTSQGMRDIIHEVTGAHFDSQPKWLKPAQTKTLHGIPLLFLSDIHFDEVVRPEEIFGVNAYNRAIAKERIQNTFSRAIDILHNYVARPEYDGIILALGGDLLSGNIHEELAETNDGVITESILELTELLAQGIRALLERFGKVHLECVVGNHGREFKKVRFKMKVRHNYEWLIYQLLAKEFKDEKNVTFTIPDGPDSVFDVYDQTFLLTHGDQFRGGSGIAGIMSPLALGMHRKQKKQSAIDRSFDVMILGHFHQYIHTNSMVVNGSIKGYDEFANNFNFPFEPAQQALWINHPKYRMVFRTPVLCGVDNVAA